MITVFHETMPGVTIHNACEDAIQMARAQKRAVVFLFNDIAVRATANDRADDLAEVYHRAFEARRAVAAKEPTYTQTQVEFAVMSSCSCGGKGPDDEGCCPACEMYHRLRGQPPKKKTNTYTPLAAIKAAK